MVERDVLVSLVNGLQKGDPEAATKLYETFQGDIYYFILKTVNNDRDLAEDLTQDTFLEILETIDKLQEPAAFVTWSKQIAYHKCTAYFRKRKELLVDENEDGYSVFDTIEEDREEFIPDAALDHEDLKQTIIKMIDDLPEEQKSAILLRYFNEISVKEIADIQGVTEGTVKSRLNYGRKSIKQAVENYEKKSGVKLHCAGIIPLLLWLFRFYRKNAGLSSSSGTAAQSFGISKASAGAAVAANSGSAITTHIFATGVKTLLTTKIVAGILVAVVTIGSIIVAGTNIHKQENKNSATAATEFRPNDTIQSEDFQPSEEGCTHQWIVEEWDSFDNTYRRQKTCSTCNYVELSGDCFDHEWSQYWTHVQTDVIEEWRECSRCVKKEAYRTYENTCAHDWYYETKHYESIYDETVYEIVVESRVCTQCRAYEELNMLCDHFFKQEQFFDRVSHAVTVEYDQCVLCGYQVILYQDEILHDWSRYSKYNGTSLIYEAYTCSKCGLTEITFEYDETCQHDWDTYSEYGDNGELIYADRCCKICGYFEELYHLE